jgi:uncharacterized protein (TIGR02444 family)
MGKPGETSGEEEALWRFSLAFYALPGVADALVALQDRRGLDVNLMLFALWLGVSGRAALDKDMLATAERVTGTLRSEIVEPLRRLRRKLRNHPDGDVQQLREGVKALELAGEKVVQARLTCLDPPARRSVPLEGRLAAARENLALYLGPQTEVAGREVGLILDTLDAFARRHGRID